jgi:inositol phosphorylceramide mannosyltransferase catalytic subunit
MIPKIFHQIWLGNAPRPAQWMDSFIRHHPDWEYRLWNESNLPILINQRLFDCSSTLAQRSDIARYELLYTHGGIYVDADSICLASWNELTDSDFFAVFEHESCRPGLIANGVIGSVPGHHILRRCIDSVVVDPDQQGIAVWKTSGPEFFSHQVNLFLQAEPSANVRIHNSSRFYPFHYTDPPPFDFSKLKNAYMAHLWGSLFGYDPSLVDWIASQAT